MDYLCVAYYCITPIQDPNGLVGEYTRFCKEMGIHGRIYINEDGVNAQLSIEKEKLNSLSEWVHGTPGFEKVELKTDPHSEHAFEKLTVKYRQQLVAVDEDVDFSLKTNYLDPKEWSRMLDQRDEETILIDVRNNYETKVGTFDGAICPDLETFREFPEYARQLATQYDLKKTKVMMCCTGGIRCEYFGPMMKKVGFENIFQLHGGIIKYGHEVGNKHWKGKLFVFDDRLTVPIHEEGQTTISECQFCKQPADKYYNCANMTCNDLFLSCEDCLKEQEGCCSGECLQTGRVRPIDNKPIAKPFRKLPFEEKLRINLKKRRQALDSLA
ncbi:MAG: hypothetical protein S4CHLAM102_04450 [Chlamydiia bacterium]|nr:hypothetical protein [Chlamydiia bacterium]